MGASNVRCVEAKIEDGKLKGKWDSSKSNGKFQVVIRENGRKTDVYNESTNEYEGPCNPACKYELLVRSQGKNTFIESDTFCTAPSKIYEVYVEMNQSAMVVSWPELSGQDVDYYLKVFKDRKCIIKKFKNGSNCNYLMDRKFVSPSCTYKFEIWAQSKHGKKEGEAICEEISVQNIDICYGIEVVGSSINITYIWEKYEKDKHSNFVSLSPGCEYKTMIEGNASIKPQYLLLRFEDLWKFGFVEHTFFNEKPQEYIVLNHAIEIDKVPKVVAFEITDTRYKRRRDSVLIESGYNSVADNISMLNRRDHEEPLTASVPSKIKYLNIEEKNGYFNLSWKELENEDVEYCVEWFCNGEPAGDVCTRHECEYKCGPIHLGKKYQFLVCARSVLEKKYGEKTGNKITAVGNLDVNYWIYTHENKVKVDFFLDQCNQQYEGKVEHGTISLSSGKVYQCEIKGEVISNPPYTQLRHEDLWKNRKVLHNFFLESDETTLRHVIGDKNKVKECVGFEWKNGSQSPQTEYFDKKSVSDHDPKLPDSHTLTAASPTYNTNANMAFVCSKADNVSATKCKLTTSGASDIELQKIPEKLQVTDVETSF